LNSWAFIQNEAWNSNYKKVICEEMSILWTMNTTEESVSLIY